MKSDFRDWSDVRVFLAVLRAGSTLAASKTLGLAQPTVARRIDALEHALGLVLFHRDTRGFRPTPDGQALVAEAQSLEAAAIAFSDRSRQLIASRTRTIRITAFKEAFTQRFTAVIEGFVGKYGDTRFEFIASDDVLDLAAGGADIAIRFAQKIDDQTLICRRIREVAYALFASESYARKHPLPSSETEFGGHKFVVGEGVHAAYEYNKWLLSRIDPGQIAIACTHHAATEAAVMTGLGIGAFPTTSGRSQAGLIECLRLPPETAVPVWLLINPAAWRRPEVKAFAAFFAPRYRAMFREM